MRAKRSLGQNFLVDGNLQRKIVAAVGAGPGDRVVEVGPGRGALTDHLAGRVGHLTLIELDDDLAAALAERYEGRPDVELLHDDVLARPLADRVDDPGEVIVVGNIPYNITTPILFHLLERPRPRRIVLMVQAEVADRIVALPGGGDYGALAVGVQSVAAVRALFGVPRSAFRPVPGVDSTVIEIVPHRPDRLTPTEEVALRSLTRSAFQWRRKQMRKILRDHPEIDLGSDAVAHLESALGMDLTRRPETFSVDELLRIARTLD